MSFAPVCYVAGVGECNRSQISLNGLMPLAVLQETKQDSDGLTNRKRVGIGFSRHGRTEKCERKIKTPAFGPGLNRRRRDQAGGGNAVGVAEGHGSECHGSRLTNTMAPSFEFSNRLSERSGIGYKKQVNCFTHIDDLAKAQQSTRFTQRSSITPYSTLVVVM